MRSSTALRARLLISARGMSLTRSVSAPHTKQLTFVEAGLLWAPFRLEKYSTKAYLKIICQQRHGLDLNNQVKASSDQPQQVNYSLVVWISQWLLQQLKENVNIEKNDLIVSPHLMHLIFWNLFIRTSPWSRLTSALMAVRDDHFSMQGVHRHSNL